MKIGGDFLQGKLLYDLGTTLEQVFCKLLPHAHGVNVFFVEKLEK